jgi:hypothetical protein
MRSFPLRRQPPNATSDGEVHYRAGDTFREIEGCKEMQEG